MTRQVKYTLVLSSTLLVIAMVPVVDAIRYYGSEEGQARLVFNRNVERISMGMSMDDITRMMGRVPEYTFSYRSYIIAYVVPPPCRWRYKTTMDGYRPGMSVQRLAELPDLYDCVQLAFNTNQVLIAYTRIGESYSVKLAKQVPVKGSHFAAIEMAGRDLEPVGEGASGHP